MSVHFLKPKEFCTLPERKELNFIGFFKSFSLIFKCWFVLFLLVSNLTLYAHTVTLCTKFEITTDDIVNYFLRFSIAMMFATYLLKIRHLNSLFVELCRWYKTLDEDRNTAVRKTCIVNLLIVTTRFAVLDSLLIVNLQEPTSQRYFETDMRKTFFGFQMRYLDGVLPEDTRKWLLIPYALLFAPGSCDGIIFVCFIIFGTMCRLLREIVRQFNRDTVESLLFLESTCAPQRLLQIQSNHKEMKTLFCAFNKFFASYVFVWYVLAFVQLFVHGKSMLLCFFNSCTAMTSAHDWLLVLQYLFLVLYVSLMASSVADSSNKTISLVEDKRLELHHSNRKWECCFEYLFLLKRLSTNLLKISVGNCFFLDRYFLFCYLSAVLSYLVTQAASKASA